MIKFFIELLAACSIHHPAASAANANRLSKPATGRAPLASEFCLHASSVRRAQNTLPASWEWRACARRLANGARVSAGRRRRRRRRRAAHTRARRDHVCAFVCLFVCLFVLPSNERRGCWLRKQARLATVAVVLVVITSNLAIAAKRQRKVPRAKLARIRHHHHHHLCSCRRQAVACWPPQCASHLSLRS